MPRSFQRIAVTINAPRAPSCAQARRVRDVLEGIGGCKNLKSLTLDEDFSRKNLKIAPVGELAELEVIDISVAFTELEALLSCRKLKAASMGGGLTDEEQAVVDELCKRGVQVRGEGILQRNPS